MMTLASYIFKPMLWQSLIIFGIGLILILMGSFAKTKADSPESKGQTSN
jgi:hypothetical protein